MLRESSIRHHDASQIKLDYLLDDYEITESVRARDNDEASPQALVEDVEDGRSEEMERKSSKERDFLKCQILEAAASVGSTDPKFSNYNIFCANQEQESGGGLLVFNFLVTLYHLLR